MICLMMQCLHLVSIIVKSYHLHCYKQANSVITYPGVSLGLRRTDAIEFLSDVGHLLNTSLSFGK